MLKSVIESYLTSIKEIQLFLPFSLLLEKMGYYDIHIIHSSTEFGKDIIAKKKEGEIIKQYSFQLKVGDINLSKFTSEIKPQLLEALTNTLSHPNFHNELEYQVYFVTTGRIIPPATISFQEFNEFVKNTIKQNPIITWEKTELINDFEKFGAESFFELHNKPEFISKFFDLYAKIQNKILLSSFDIYYYTNRWLELDIAKTENKLQILFEGYFFSKLLLEKGFYYESSLFVVNLQRVLMKHNIYTYYQRYTNGYLLFIIESYFDYYKEAIKQKNKFFLHETGTFTIFYYPLKCIKSLELFALHVLLSEKENISIKEAFYELLKEKGSYKILSDNYAVAFLLICLVLLKDKNKIELEKYLINCTVWLCDRYSENGLSCIGSSLKEEMEQLLSENLDGLNYFKRKTSFFANILLDVAAIINDNKLYEDIANDLRALEIMLEYYHINNMDELYDYSKIKVQTDYDFSLKLNDEYSHIIKFVKQNSKLDLTKEKILILIFSLRDRYFPNYVFNLFK